MSNKPKVRKYIKVLCRLIADRRSKEEKDQSLDEPRTSGRFSLTSVHHGGVRWASYELEVNDVHVYMSAPTERARDINLCVAKETISLRLQEQVLLQREAQKKIVWILKRDQREALGKFLTAATTPRKVEVKSETKDMP